MASLFSGGWEGGCGKAKEVILTMMNHECPGSPGTTSIQVCWYVVCTGRASVGVSCKYTEI